ncbi:hypothetical protein NNC19_05795 [Clostridium sp. SHJSY1]|uniref:hypothetical protein n=1 Tax=Clostridium sp. SHJSY1 TaxID=2942483 RepID=UPI0028747C26|nr:hypothetical protein [Clostridium sp. SHJSY1]MDS0525187.1 hypothetical protein [Clostridium sp. SHJSY1]
MFLHNLITHTLGLLLMTVSFIYFIKQVFINKKISLRNGEKKPLSELTLFQKCGVFFLGIFSLVIGIIMLIIDIPYIKDFSAYNNSKYEIIENSNVEKVQCIKGSRSPSYDLITINGVDYKVEEVNEIKEGDSVQIFYLHNTKIIMDFKINH